MPFFAFFPEDIVMQSYKISGQFADGIPFTIEMPNLIDNLVKMVDEPGLPALDVAKFAIKGRFLVNGPL